MGHPLVRRGEGSQRVKTLGMTIYFGSRDLCFQWLLEVQVSPPNGCWRYKSLGFQNKLSSRPERSVVEGPAVLVVTQTLQATSSKRQLLGFSDNLLNQVIVISAALSAGMMQVVWFPDGVSVAALAGAKLPSLLTVAP
jgi:hypothetical protein